MDYRERHEQLNRELWRHAKLYYNLDAPEISDARYDLMEAELLKIEDAHPELVTSRSRSQNVGWSEETDPYSEKV